MFSFGSNFRRRVSVSHKHGALVVSIARQNDRTTYILMLLAFTAGFMFFCYVFISPFFRLPFSRDMLYLLPFLAFIVLWYVIGLRIGVWRAFGVEEIVVGGGTLCWTRTALYWIRKLEIQTMNITEVRALTPWHALSNRVEFTAHKQRYVIGDMLLRDETTELAEHLRHAVGLR
jgi:hypothetical protein